MPHSTGYFMRIRTNAVQFRSWRATYLQLFSRRLLAGRPNITETIFKFLPEAFAAEVLHESAGKVKMECALVGGEMEVDYEEAGFDALNYFMLKNLSSELFNVGGGWCLSHYKYNEGFLTKIMQMGALLSSAAVSNVYFIVSFLRNVVALNFVLKYFAEVEFLSKAKATKNLPGGEVTMRRAAVGQRPRANYESEVHVEAASLVAFYCSFLRLYLWRRPSYRGGVSGLLSFRAFVFIYSAR
jgi:hypothetical protein